MFSYCAGDGAVCLAVVVVVVVILSIVVLLFRYSGVQVLHRRNKTGQDFFIWVIKGVLLLF